MKNFDSIELQNQEIERSTNEEHLGQLHKQMENMPNWLSVKDEETFRRLAAAGAGGSY